MILQKMVISLERQEDGKCLFTDKLVVQGTSEDLDKLNMIIMSASDLLQAEEEESKGCGVRK